MVEVMVEAEVKYKRHRMVEAESTGNIGKFWR